jgi:hypothetical protein
MPKIFICGEFKIDALRLEDYANLPPQASRFLHRVAAHDGRAPGAGDHQRGKNSKERRLPAAVWTEQPEQLRSPHVERNPVQCGAVLVAMHQVLHGNHSNGGRRDYFRRAIGECGNFGCQECPGTNLRLVYDDTLQKMWK